MNAARQNHRAGASLFQGLTLQDMRLVRQEFDDCHLADGQVVPRSTAQTLHIGLVKGGALREDVPVPQGGTRLFSLNFAGEVLPPRGLRHKGGPLRAIGATRLLSCDRDVFRTLAARIPRLQVNLLGLVQDQIAEAQRWQTLLGRKTATERVASLLSWFHNRQGAPVEMPLPVGRGELGEISGLTLETVSRQIRRLEKMGVIALPKTHVVRVLDAEALSDLSDGTVLARAA